MRVQTAITSASGWRLVIPLETTVQLRAVQLFKHGTVHVVYGTRLANGHYVTLVCEATAGQRFGPWSTIAELPWRLMRITEGEILIDEYLREISQ